MTKLKHIAQSATLSLLGFALVFIIVMLCGGNPFEALFSLFRGSLEGTYSLAETLIRTTPLLLTGLGVGLAFKCGVWNIGAEGQFYIGALIVTALATLLGSLPHPISIIAALAAAFCGGGVWALIAAFLRTRRNVQEVISTIMLNFLALQIVSWAVHGPLKESTGRFPYSNEIPTSLMLSRLLVPTRLHFGVIIALATGVVVWIILFRTIWGFQVRTTGASLEAARHSGIHPERMIWSAMFVSGGLAGMAGAIELMGLTHILFEQFSPGYGYTAVAVALLGGLHPLGIAFSALLFGALQAGASAMQRDAGISAVLIYVIQGIIIFQVALQTTRPSTRRLIMSARALEEV